MSLQVRVIQVMPTVFGEPRGLGTRVGDCELASLRDPRGESGAWRGPMHSSSSGPQRKKQVEEERWSVAPNSGQNGRKGLQHESAAKVDAG